ncbi:MAG: response regulator transcription factor [Phaeodactylibacter sp.]|nr:response regulator transcription factor [Phaeodactylibacter sp.]
MREKSIRVFIADDHSLLVDALKARFIQSGEFEFAGRASTMEELHARLNGQADVLLLDKMEDTREMLASIASIRNSCPAVKVVLLTGKEDLAFAKQALEEGARGYFSKSLSMEEIFQGLRKVHAGGVVIDLGKAGPNREDERMKAKELITPTEKQVIALLCRGFRGKEIAELLSQINGRNMEPSTVEVHKRRIREKLRDIGVTNDASLGYWACECNLLDGTELSTNSED